MHVFSRNILIQILLLAIIICGMLLTGCVTGRFTPDGWAGPVISGDSLYICSLEGKFLALDLPDRNTLRDFTPGDQKESSSFLGCTGQSTSQTIAYATPIISGSMFYVGTYSGEVYALDTTNGAKKWDYTTDNNIVGGLALAGDALIVPSDDKLYKFDAQNGGILWNEPFDTSGKIWSTPVVSGSTVYFGNLDHKLYAVDLESGEERWERGFAGAIASTALIIDDTLYIGTFDKKFYALDTKSGEDKWEKPFTTEDWFWNKAAFDNGTIYVGTLGGTVYAINAATGTHKWIYETESRDRFRSAPVIVGDVLVIGCQDDRVYGLDTETGTQKWAPLNFEDDILADPWVEGTTVYFLDQDNKLHAIDAKTGNQIWAQPLDID